MARRILSSRELDRQKTVTELLTRYRRARDKKIVKQPTHENPDELMLKAQVIIGSTTSKRMR